MSDRLKNLTPEQLLRVYKRVVGQVIIIDENDGYTWGFMKNRYHEVTKNGRVIDWWLTDLMLREVKPHLAN